jgi:hypothetical protein
MTRALACGSYRESWFGRDLALDGLGGGRVEHEHLIARLIPPVIRLHRRIVTVEEQ